MNIKDLDIVYLSTKRCTIYDEVEDKEYFFDLSGEVWVEDDSFGHHYGIESSINEYNDLETVLTSEYDGDKIDLENVVRELILDEWVDLYKTNNSIYYR